MDEADTQFGGVGADTHETERRLTGKLQAMMSDSELRGRVAWLLVTARIRLLSPDIRGPGRVGDLIILILDPKGTDREEFLRWTLKGSVAGELTAEQFQQLSQATRNYSTAGFAALRSELKAKATQGKGPLPLEQVLAVVNDLLPPAIEDTRRYQTLQVLTNCTRRSLLPNPDVKEEQRKEWAAELRLLEAKGVR